MGQGKKNGEMLKSTNFQLCTISPRGPLSGIVPIVNHVFHNLKLPIEYILSILITQKYEEIFEGDSYVYDKNVLIGS